MKEGNKIKWGIVSGVVFLVGAYLFLLSNSVSATGLRRDNEEKIIQLNAEVSALEVDYLSQLSLINLELVGQLGFVDAASSAGFAIEERPLGLLQTNN